MKKSNQFLFALGSVSVFLMVLINTDLAFEYQKIDLSDPLKNYVQTPVPTYTHIKLSGSNGYPIEIRQTGSSEMLVLRSRIDHVNYNLVADTLFIEFTGANISQHQSKEMDIPPAIILHGNILPTITATDVHCRITGFEARQLDLTTKGNSLVEIESCRFRCLNIHLSDQSELVFIHENRIDSLALNMVNTSVAILAEIDVKHIREDLGDSISIVLSNDLFSEILK